MDNIFCRHLTATKKQILLPWSVILEGHGWWHILTGLGTFKWFSLSPDVCESMIDADVETGGMCETRETTAANN
jgi:hypothetical protein